MRRNQLQEISSSLREGVELFGPPFSLPVSTFTIELFDQIMGLYSVMACSHCNGPVEVLQLLHQLVIFNSFQTLLTAGVAVALPVGHFNFFQTLFTALFFLSK